MLTVQPQIDWYTDFFYPFVNKWAARVRAVSSPDKIVLCEPIPNEVGISSFACTSSC